MVHTKHFQEIHKFLFGSVALILLIAFVSVMTYQQTSITGNVIFEQGLTIQNIAYLQPGTNMLLDIKNVPNVNLATMYTTGLIKEGQVTFQEERLAFDGTVLSAFSVSSTHEDAISYFDLTLKVPIQSVQDNNLFKEQVSIYTHSGTKILTTYTESSERYHFYSAKIDSFGNYVIGIKNEVENVAEPIPEVPEPEVEEQSIVGNAIVQEEPIQKEKGFFARFFSSIFG
jgi:hypothetical protein